MVLRRALSHLSDDQLAMIESISGNRSFSGGKHIIDQGDRPDRLFIVKSGEARVTLKGAATIDIEFTGPLGPGDLFGELSFMDGESASATITADGDVDLIEIDGPKLRAAIDKDPALAAAIYKSLLETVIKRLRRTNMRIAPSSGLGTP